MKKNLLTAAAAAVLFLTACAQTAMSENPTPAAAVANASDLTAQTAPAEELTLNDGNFYFMGDTDACYVSVKDGNIRFVGTDENMRTYYSAREESYNKRAGGSPSIPFEDYEDYESFCENIKYMFHDEWVPYEIATLPDPISITVVFLDPYYDADGMGPGGISMDYIDENNIGYPESESGGIDFIFTRVADSE